MQHHVRYENDGFTKRNSHAKLNMCSTPTRPKHNQEICVSHSLCFYFSNFHDSLQTITVYCTMNCPVVCASVPHFCELISKSVVL